MIASKHLHMRRKLYGYFGHSWTLFSRFNMHPCFRSQFLCQTTAFKPHGQLLGFRATPSSLYVYGGLTLLSAVAFEQPGR